MGCWYWYIIKFVAAEKSTDYRRIHFSIIYCFLISQPISSYRAVFRHQAKVADTLK